MSDRMQPRPASSGSFASSLTTRYVARARHEEARGMRQAILLLVALQVLLWIWTWHTQDEPRARAQDLIRRAWPAFVLWLLLCSRSPRAATIVAALVGWILCVVILGLAL